MEKHVGRTMHQRKEVKRKQIWVTPLFVIEEGGGAGKCFIGRGVVVVGKLLKETLAWGFLAG